MFRNLKKLFTIFWTSMLFLCVTVSVNAASATHTITIKNAGAGHTYEVYEVFKGNVSTNGHIGDANWGDGVNYTALLSALKESDAFNNLFDDCESANDVIAVISNEENDSEFLKELAQVIGSNLTTSKTEMSYSEGKYNATLEPGYYFIKDQDGTSLGQTRYILTLTEDQEITVKGETPTIAVGTSSSSSLAGYIDDFQVGDEIELQMVGSLPSYNSFSDYNTYKYAFHVTIPNGLVVVDTPTVGLYRGTEKIGDIDLTSFRYVPTSNGFDIVCDNLKNIAGLSAKLQEVTGTVYSPSVSDTLQIRVTYKVKANMSVQFANQIKQTIEYSNNPNKNGEGQTATTPVNNTILYTYTLEVKKQEKNTAKVLDGVGFKLYRTDNNKWATVEKGVITGWVDSESKATELFTENGGKIKVIGLDSKIQYALKETNPLDGYNTMADAKFIITSEFREGKLNTLKITVNSGTPTDGDVENGIVSILVENSQGKILPSTGGIGTIIFYIIGALLLLIAIILIIIICKRKKDEEEEKKENNLLY